MCAAGKQFLASISMCSGASNDPKGPLDCALSSVMTHSAAIEHYSVLHVHVNGSVEPPRHSQLQPSQKHAFDYRKHFVHLTC